MHVPISYNPDASRPVSVEVAQGTDSDLVYQWRLDEFQRMGFMRYVAEMLAAGRIDLHQMEDLLKAGCEHHLALEILAGTAWNGEDEAFYTCPADQAVREAPEASQGPSEGAV